MNICVCIKQVPDLNSAVDTGRAVLNAYDASSVEEALVLREQHGGTIHLVQIGPEKATETIRKALAMGADSATHIVMDIDGMDSKGFATVLARYFQDNQFDVIACGKQAQDSDAGLTGSMLAELLGIKYTSNAVGLAIADGNLIVTRQADAGQEEVVLSTPCLVTCSNDMNDPRIASLKGIMAAKKKTIEQIEGWQPVKPELIFEGYEPLPEREPGIILEGETTEKVAGLVERLINDARVLA